MHQDAGRPLTFETLLSDPLTRLVMEADGITPDEVAAVLRAARDAIAARSVVVMRAVAGSLAMNAPA